MSFAKTLKRDEMKSLMAGNSDFITCTCYKSYGGKVLGTVQCSEDIGSLDCCWVHYEKTSYVDCAGEDDPGEN